jgi:hypothetical protein
MANKLRTRPLASMAVGMGAVIGALALMPTKKKATSTHEDLEKGWFGLQRISPDKYVGLVQQMDKQKINHHKTNGY